ncbi:hypothetical protein BDC45DRAFT_540349 [Circinella umbellata]|nr:hypothetical protein BDC45DRAFT_540349 [Circinella umbellata]
MLLQYISNNTITVCLSNQEQKALNKIKNYKTSDDLEKCCHDLFSPNEKSDSICFICSALDQMHIKNYDANSWTFIVLQKADFLTSFFHDRIRPHWKAQECKRHKRRLTFDLSFLYTKVPNSYSSECCPLYQSYSSVETNQVGCIITSSETYNLLFVEEKPPGSAPLSVLKDLRNPSIHNYMEVLSLKWDGYNPILCGMKLKRILEYNKKKLDWIIEEEKKNTDESKIITDLQDIVFINLIKYYIFQVPYLKV